jgi:hypothetical protein
MVIMTINKPIIDADDYLTDDIEDVAPKHGTTVQAGWAAADALLKPKKESGEYASDFRFTEQAQLIRFLEDEPFSVYFQHWIDREGKKSFVCLGDDCPLCTIAGDKPRGKFAFNVLVLSDEEPGVMILTAPPTLARQLKAANDDAKRGPLTKYYWAISRQGSATTTQYVVDRVKAMDLAEEWELDVEVVEAAIASSVKYDSSVVYVSPQEELLKLARQLVS